MSVRRTTAAGAVALGEAPAVSHAAEAGCNRGKHWQVQKFGGSCVSAAERISAVAKLVVDGSSESTQQVIHFPLLEYSPFFASNDSHSTTCLTHCNTSCQDTCLI